MQEFGWLDGKIIHDWWEYAGRYLQSKYGKTPEKWKAIKAQLTDCQQTASRLPHIDNLTNLTKITEPKDIARTRKHSFEKSPFFEFEAFKQALKDWPEEKCRDYHERAKLYSGANGGKYLNWVMAVQNWERSDSEKKTKSEKKEYFSE